MSYRLVDANKLALKYPEVNDMPCIYADLDNGLDGEHYDLSAHSAGNKGDWIERRNKATGHIESVCSVCGAEESYPYNLFCPNCGADMRGGQDGDK